MKGGGVVGVGKGEGRSKERVNREERGYWYGREE